MASATVTAEEIHRSLWRASQLARGRGRVSIVPSMGLQRMVSPGERIEAGWFDGELVTRDYFVAQAEDQSCYWTYRERVSSRDAEDEQRWFLQGLFG
jgi:hypothetical protein